MKAHNPSTWSTAKKITTGKRRQNAEPKYQNAYPTSNRNSPSHPTHHGGGLYNHGRLVSHSPFIRPLPQPHAPIRTYLSHHLSPHALFWRAGHDIWLASIHYHNQRPSLQDLRFEHGAVFGVQCLVCGGVAGIRCGARRGNRVDVHESTPLGFCRELCFYGWEFVGC